MSESVEKGEWPSSELPACWQWVQFSDFFNDRTDSRRKLPKKEYGSRGIFPVVDQGEEKVGGYSNRRELVSKAQVPCIVWGDHTQCVKFIDREFIQGADGVKVLEPRGNIDPQYAYRALQAVRLPKKGYSRHFKFLRSTKFPVAPASEQRRIVVKLETLLTRSEAARDELARIAVLIEHYKQAILEKAFRGELTADWRSRNALQEPVLRLLPRLLRAREERWRADEVRKAQVAERHHLPGRWRSKYKRPHITEAESLGDLPNGWQWLPVDALAWKVVDGVHKKPSYVEKGVPFVTVKNLTAGPGIDLSDLNHVSIKDHIQFCMRANPERDDVLISKDGTLGVVRRIKEEPSYSIFVSVALVKPSMIEMSSYIEWAFRAPQVQGQMVGVGSGLQHIHLTDLRQDIIPVAPLEEQIEIVRRIEAAMSWLNLVASEQEQALQLLEHLDQGLLTKAFRGELVPQDPNDEPAEKLLERVGAARAAKPEARRRRPSGPTAKRVRRAANRRARRVKG